MYEPGDDSFLILKHIKKYAKPNSLVLDMGTGSGIQAQEASHYAKVIAVDADEEVIDYCLKKYEDMGVEFRYSNLFENVSEKFDLIIFNPPYLPSCSKDPDLALDGGPQGWELIGRFLKDAKKHLNPKGKILLLFSSFSNKKKVDSILKSENYSFKEIDKLHIHFEDLYVYVLKA